MPASTKAIDNKVENLLPFVSAKVFMQSNPINEPNENIVCKITLLTLF